MTLYYVHEDISFCYFLCFISCDKDFFTQVQINLFKENVIKLTKGWPNNHICFNEMTTYVNPRNKYFITFFTLL